MLHPISITAITSVSPLGDNPVEVWNSYGSESHCLQYADFDGNQVWVGQLSGFQKDKLDEVRKANGHYKSLDDTVIFAISAARNAIQQAAWKSSDNFGVNIGSSRGATGLFEKYYKEFLQSQKTGTLASPTTTLGNISSWVAHDLQTQGPELSHSITCSTGLHAFLNGVAWLQSGMAEKFLVGGSEAPLTPFTIAQMQALKIYAKSGHKPDLEMVTELHENSKEKKKERTTTQQAFRALAAANSGYPCQALKLDKNENTMVLGEGAAMACLEIGQKQNALAMVAGIGYATEVLTHGVSISSDAQCFQRSMQMALCHSDPSEVDVIVMHAPGTIKGDTSEYEAIKKVFPDHMPLLTTNKWKIGHTFGTSGMLSLELAILMLQHQQFVGVPYLTNSKEQVPMRKILVNAVGFGGNAVSILLSRG